ELKEVSDESQHERANRTDCEEPAHEAEVTLALDRVGRQAEECRRGRPEGRHHELRAVRQRLQVELEDRSEREPEEARQSESPHETPAAVLCLVNSEQKPEVH